MDDNLGSGLPRWGPSHAAANLVDRRLDLVAADWQSSCIGVHGDAVGLLRVLVGALHDCGGNTRAGHHHPSAARQFESWREHFAQLEPGAITCLREVLRRQVLLDLPPQEALAALHCVSATLDELHRLVTSWAGERLQQLAYVDELTGLGNRRAALESAHAFVATAVRHDRPLTVVVVDVDGLKRVNDGQGHDAGDALLRRLADAFRSGLREGDTAYRTGGDEFLVLLPETTLADAEVVVSRVRAAGAPSFSYGTAEAPDEAMTVDEVVRVADQRLLEERRIARTLPVAPEPRPTALVAGRFLVGAGMLALALAAVLGARTAVSGFDLTEVASVTGVGILVALLAAAAQSSRRSPAAVTILAPLLGVAAASAAAPMFDAETRPSERIEHVARPTTVSSAATNGRAAIVEVPTGTVPAFPSWLGSTTTTTTSSTTTTTTTTTVPTPAALLAPSTTTTTTTTAKPTTTTTTSTTTTTTVPATTTSVAAASRPSTTTTTTPPARAVAVDDQVLTEKRNVVVEVLANDYGRQTTLDPGTVSIVRRPASGTATIRGDGTVHVKGGDEPTLRFLYQVCATNRTCARAWVTVERIERSARQP